MHFVDEPRADFVVADLITRRHGDVDDRFDARAELSICRRWIENDLATIGVDAGVELREIGVAPTRARDDGDSNMRAATKTIRRRTNRLAFLVELARRW